MFVVSKPVIVSFLGQDPLEVYGLGIIEPALVTVEETEAIWTCLRLPNYVFGF